MGISGNERTDSTAKAAQQKYVSDCLISYTDAYQYISQYVHDLWHHVVVIDLPLLRVAVEGSDNPVSLEKPCQASLPPDQQGRHSLGRHPEVQYVA